MLPASPAPGHARRGRHCASTTAAPPREGRSAPMPLTRRRSNQRFLHTRANLVAISALPQWPGAANLLTQTPSWSSGSSSSSSLPGQSVVSASRVSVVQTSPPEGSTASRTVVHSSAAVYCVATCRPQVLNKATFYMTLFPRNPWQATSEIYTALCRVRLANSPPRSAEASSHTSPTPRQRQASWVSTHNHRNLTLPCTSASTLDTVHRAGSMSSDRQVQPKGVSTQRHAALRIHLTCHQQYNTDA